MLHKYIVSSGAGGMQHQQVAMYDSFFLRQRRHVAMIDERK
jgi:hypothetical protein